MGLSYDLTYPLALGYIWMEIRVRADDSLSGGTRQINKGTGI